MVKKKKMKGENKIFYGECYCDMRWEEKVYFSGFAI